MRNPPPEHQPGPDGHTRSPKAEERLDLIVEAAFDTEPGRQTLDYLKSITINHVLSPQATDAELRSLEGARRLVAIIQARLARAEKLRKSAAQPPKE